MFDDEKCQGGCSHGPMHGAGNQVRWNPVAALHLCATCNAQWSEFQHARTIDRWVAPPMKEWLESLRAGMDRD